MERRIVWVHGIGDHAQGYSDSWRQAFDPHLQLTAESYVEVHWETVFDPPDSLGCAAATRAREALTLTPEEGSCRRRRLRAELTVLLQARQSALEQGPAREGRESALPSGLRRGLAGVWRGLRPAAPGVGRPGSAVRRPR